MIKSMQSFPETIADKIKTWLMTYYFSFSLHGGF